MTHLSDFSFLQRALSILYLCVWYMYRVYKLDRFKSFSFARVRKGELKSIVSILLMFMIPAQLYYDIATCIIKYQEGFTEIFGHIFTKPDSQWTAANKQAIIPASYSICIGFSFQTGTLLLLQCFWNYLANSVAQQRFMSSKEFKFYIGWTIVSIIIFPMLQYNFSRDVYNVTLKEAVPQLVYGCELLIVSLLGFRSHSRFQKLVNNSKESNSTSTRPHRLIYFQDLNMLLAMVLLIDSLSLIILSADGLTGRKYLNSHKFSADFLICNINITSVLVWFIVILIFHPAPTPPVFQGNSSRQQNVPANNQRTPQLQSQEISQVSTGPYATATMAHKSMHHYPSGNDQVYFTNAPVMDLYSSGQPVQSVTASAVTLVPSVTNQHYPAPQTGKANQRINYQWSTNTESNIIERNLNDPRLSTREQNVSMTHESTLQTGSQQQLQQHRGSYWTPQYPHEYTSDVNRM